MRVSRKTKKKIRAILLCHTGNRDCRKLKVPKSKWIQLKQEYKVWLKCFDMTDRSTANTVK